MDTVRKRYILRITIGYAVIASLWILLSDQLLSMFVDISSIIWLATVKGLAFILATAVLLYFALDSVSGKNGISQSGPEPIDTMPFDTFSAISETTERMPRWIFYAFAVLLTGAILLVRAEIAVSFGDRPLLILFVLPIVLSALLGGAGPGLVSTAVSALGAAYFMSPAHSFYIAAVYDRFQWGMLIANGVIISFLSEATRRAFRRAKAMSRHLQAIVTGTPDAVYIKDAKGRYQLFNEGAARLVGKPAAEIIGRDDNTIFSSEAAARLKELDRSIMESGKTQTREEYLTTINRKEKVFLATKGPVFDHYGNIAGLFGISRDITDLKEADREKENALELLRLCNESSTIKDLIGNIVQHFKKTTGCTAVGVRLRQGDDFPYYETQGFPDDFILLENNLCSYDENGGLIRDSTGGSALDCMCGSILRGRFDPARPFFSQRGSFWTSNTTELLASTSEQDRHGKTRNRCNSRGYESVALIPIRAAGEIMGLLQLNDRRKGRFNTAMISTLEDRVNYVGITLEKLITEQALFDSETMYRSLFENMLNGFAYCRMLYENEKAVDFIYLRVNHAFEVLTGLTDVVGKRISEIIPGIREADPQLLEMYGRVAMTGTPERFEYFLKVLDMWLWVSVYSPKREHFVAVFDVINDRKKAEQEKALYQRQLELLLETAGDGIFGVDREGKITFANQAAARLIGMSKDALVGLRSHEIFHTHCSDGAEYPWHDCPLCKTLIDGLSRFGEETYFKANGSTFPIEFTCTAIIEEGVTSGAVMMFRDITDRKRMENELRQSQKLEGIGQLASGIAHDFNNVLSAVVGFAGMLQMKLDKSDSLQHFVDQIMAAGQRGADLTQQILAFSRKQTLNRKSVSLNMVIRNLEKMLHRLVREDIAILLDLSQKDLVIFADTSQIEQILINLATNARDAMPKGGRLIIATERVITDEKYVEMHGSGSPGEYVLLTVSDTGCGMDAEVRSRIFEPFFTMKEAGKGTGLGLSVVHGIVKQHNGFISVYSEPGIGTVFKIYLPLTTQASEGPTEKDFDNVRGGAETILVAEDDASLRSLSKTLLEQHGYTVIDAVDGEDAVRNFLQHRDEIKLVILDCIMPNKGGEEAYNEIYRLSPGMKVIFLSGYIEDSFDHIDFPENQAFFIQKPILPNDLLRNVRAILDG